MVQAMPKMLVSGRLWRATGVATSILVSIMSVAGAGMPASREGAGAPRPDARITGFHLVETRGGVKLWEVWGDIGEVYERAGIAKVSKVNRQVTVTLHSEEGTLTSRSDTATLNMRTKDVRLEGNVTAISERGTGLHTQSLDWSAQDRRLFTRAPVTLTRGGMISQGIGLEAETDLERARLLSRVRSRVVSGGGGEVPTTVPVPHKGEPR